MTIREILLDHSIFENPQQFHPERWLSTNPDVERLQHYFVPFGRGSRMCIGVKWVLSITGNIKHNLSPLPRCAHYWRLSTMYAQWMLKSPLPQPRICRTIRSHCIYLPPPKAWVIWNNPRTGCRYRARLLHWRNITELQGYESHICEGIYSLRWHSSLSNSAWVIFNPIGHRMNLIETSPLVMWLRSSGVMLLDK